MTISKIPPLGSRGQDPQKPRWEDCYRLSGYTHEPQTILSVYIIKEDSVTD